MMAATPIYDKKLKKIFFSGTKGPMTLGLGKQHWGSRPNKVCSNDGLELTLTFFTARSNASLCFYMGKYTFLQEKCKKAILWKTLTTNDRSDKMFLLTSKFCPQGVGCPCPGAIYVYKIMKNVYKIRLLRDLFETCNK